MKSLVILLALFPSIALAKVYVIVEGGRVTNVVEWDGQAEWAPSRDNAKTMVDVTAKNKVTETYPKPGAPDAISMGDSYLGNNTFAKP